jgi:hypothetical protein
VDTKRIIGKNGGPRRRRGTKPVFCNETDTESVETMLAEPAA